MKKFKIMMLITLTWLFLIACSNIKQDDSSINSSTPMPSASASNDGQTERSYDLANKDFFKKFIRFLSLKPELLVDALQQEFGETPVKGYDQEAEAQFIRLEKAGLNFYITDNEDIPVSHIEVDSSSPIHLSGAKGKMPLADIMKYAGKTMVYYQGASTAEEKAAYRISYPLDGATVNFTTNFLSENAAKMDISSWGYYDEAPKQSSATRVELEFGTFSIPEHWVGKVAADDGYNQFMLYLIGHTEAYPLFAIEQVHWTDDEIDSENKAVIGKTEDTLIYLTDFTPDIDQWDRSQYMQLKHEIIDILPSFKLSDPEGRTYLDLQKSACNEQVVQLSDADEIEQAFSDFFERYSFFPPNEQELNQYYWEMGDCFSNETHKLLDSHPQLQAKIEALRDRMNRLNHSWMEIRSIIMGGVMWDYFTSRSDSFNEVVLHIYLKQLLSDHDSKPNRELYDEAVTKLKKYQRENSELTIHPIEDLEPELIQEKTKKLNEAYSDILTFFDNDSDRGTSAAAYMLNYLCRYSGQMDDV